MAKVEVTTQQPKNTDPANPSDPANPADPSGGARPGTSDASAGKVEKILHPLLVGPPGEDGEPTRTKIEEVPGDYDPKVHFALRRADFTKDWIWMEMMAETMERRAVAYRKEAEISKKLGSKAARAKANRLRQMMQRLEELKKSLGEEGIDADQYLEDVREDALEEATTEATTATEAA